MIYEVFHMCLEIKNNSNDIYFGLVDFSLNIPYSEKDIS